MIERKDLVVGEIYRCKINDIVSGWEDSLEWLGDGWSHATENIDGYYPCIVEYAICKL